MTIQAIHTSDAAPSKGFVLPLLVGTGVLAFLLWTGNDLLQDSDLFWQIEVGRWILDHGAVPDADPFSFTKLGAPWISSSWLAQVILALAMKAGWAGPVIVASLAIAAAFAVFAGYLERHASALLTTVLVLAAFILVLPHLLVRPHVLALPLLAGWFIGLIDAADRQRAPRWWLLIVLALWANLHGGFVLGLLLIGPVGLEALRQAAPKLRLALALRWTAFGLGAVLACCATPYGWHTLLAAGQILSLGEVLSTVSEWTAADFSKFGPFEASLLALLGVALWRGLTLPWPRLLLVLGLIHMALAHVRSIESFALLVPLILAKPWSEQWLSRSRGPTPAKADVAPPVWAGVIVLFAIIGATIAAEPYLHYQFVATQIPAQALAAAQRHGATRILNGYIFGGYLISQKVPVFIDGRAELYGEKMVMDMFRASAGRDVEALDRMIEEHHVDATMLPPSAAAVRLLDQRAGWRRLHADDVAVVHVRDSR
uniref:Glycosyltransferase RgtA/B/C/D-like domain-containing protein n=1 Tax=Rhodopseudomonas palustris (strain BisA53) TaxID=316055 RepID=Q07PD5_RHOP5